MKRRGLRGSTGTFLARGARRGMAKKRGDSVTSRDLRGGAASLSLGRRRSAHSVHRARWLCLFLLFSIQSAAIHCSFFQTINVSVKKKKNSGA